VVPNGGSYLLYVNDSKALREVWYSKNGGPLLKADGPIKANCSDRVEVTAVYADGSRQTASAVVKCTKPMPSPALKPTMGDTVGLALQATEELFSHLERDKPVTLRAVDGSCDMGYLKLSVEVTTPGGYFAYPQPRPPRLTLTCTGWTNPYTGEMVTLCNEITFTKYGFNVSGIPAGPDVWRVDINPGNVWLWEIYVLVPLNLTLLAPAYTAGSDVAAEIRTFGTLVIYSHAQPGGGVIEVYWLDGLSPSDFLGNLYTNDPYGAAYFGITGYGVVYITYNDNDPVVQKVREVHYADNFDNYYDFGNFTVQRLFDCQWEILPLPPIQWQETVPMTKNLNLMDIPMATDPETNKLIFAAIMSAKTMDEIMQMLKDLQDQGKLKGIFEFPVTNYQGQQVQMSGVAFFRVSYDDNGRIVDRGFHIVVAQTGGFYSGNTGGAGATLNFGGDFVNLVINEAEFYGGYYGYGIKPEVECLTDDCTGIHIYRPVQDIIVTGYRTYTVTTGGGTASKYYAKLYSAKSRAWGVEVPGIYFAFTYYNATAPRPVQPITLTLYQTRTTTQTTTSPLFPTR